MKVEAAKPRGANQHGEKDEGRENFPSSKERKTGANSPERIIARLADCIASAVHDGSLSAPGPLPALDPLSMARTLYQLWLGASLLAKLHRDESPLEHAWVLTQGLLAP